MSNWLYENKEFTEELIQDNVGYVYIILNNLTGKRYIGKKLFTAAKTKQVKGKKKKYRVSSDWQNYYGSNKELQDDVLKFGTENFTRKILMLCKTRSIANYMESYYIFSSHALCSDLYYNGWVSARVTRKHLGPLQNNIFLTKRDTLGKI